jgi:hypothetical protein
MNDAPANLPASGLAGPKRGEGWSRTKWLTLITLIFAAHVALIFLFSSRKPIVPRPVTNVPALELANDSGGLPALDNPALFALPNPQGFASAVWRKIPAVQPPSFRWTEAPRWLPLSADELGAAFGQFMRTNLFAVSPLDFKPVPELSAPVLPVEPALAQNSTLQIKGGLAQRRLLNLNEISLPSLPYDDVIAPSVVRVLVDAAGNVVSAVVLPPANSLEATGQYIVADQRALELARRLRFAPAARLMFGEIIFNWHTVPPAATNMPAASP